MELLYFFMDFVLHVDRYIEIIISKFGVLAYLIVFLLIFTETGAAALFLPGDSLLFASGAFAAIGSFKIGILLAFFWLASFCGDNLNYWIGRVFGRKIIKCKYVPIKESHLNKTQDFYDKYGSKTVFLARFTPIVRSLSPFVAGIGKMHYTTFMRWSLLGSVLWTCGFVTLGYFFGNMPVVKDNFSLVILAIIAISISPVIKEVIKMKFKK